MNVEEQLARTALYEACVALKNAIAAFERAGYGQQVTIPLREALANAQYSLREVQP